MDPEQQRLNLKLRDGTPVSARPLGPADRAELADGYQLLSTESRYQRFWTRTGEVIGERMLDRLLHDDNGNHVIWAVLDASRDYPGTGAASYWRFLDDPTKAEFSCTVLDEDQRKGVGTLLLAALWLAAFRVGIKRFTGYTMPENVAAVRWMRDTGAEAEWDGYKVIFRWSLDELDRIPETTVGAALAERLSELAPVMLPD